MSDFKVGDKVRPKPDSAFTGDELPWTKRGDHLTRGEFVISRIEPSGYDHYTAPKKVMCAISKNSENIPLSCLELVPAIPREEDWKVGDRCSSVPQVGVKVPSLPPLTPGYLDCTDGKTQLHWPNVKPTMLAENKPIHATDTAVNSRSKMATMNVTDCIVRLGTTLKEFGLTNNSDRRAMLPELKQVERMAKELTKRIKESL